MGQLTKEQKDIRLKAIINNMAYEDELEGVETLSEQELKEGKNDILSYITTLDKIPSVITNNDEFITILASIFYKNNNYSINDFDNEDILERYNWYVEGFNFFNDDNAFNIYSLYGDIVKKDSNGFYELNDNIVDTIIKQNNLYITSDKSDIKQAIYDAWENQKELLTTESLNEYTKERNGLPFKYFIFCEEYIKRGKIKPTCEYLGISRNTAYLWLKNDDVQNYLKQRQEEIKQDTDNTFKNTYNECFNELNNMINSNMIATDDKIKAISTFLKHYENMQRLKQPLGNNND